jgi:hypothetical protein
MVARKEGVLLVCDFDLESVALMHRCGAFVCCFSSCWPARVARGGGEGAVAPVDLMVGFGFGDLLLVLFRFWGS